MGIQKTYLWLNLLNAGWGGGAEVGELCIEKHISYTFEEPRGKEKALSVRKLGPTPYLMVSAYSSNSWTCSSCCVKQDRKHLLRYIADVCPWHVVLTSIL